MVKCDIKSAYRLLRIREADWHWFGFRFDGCYFFDTVMPMECASSCRSFERFSRAHCSIAQTFFPCKSIIQYLDDYLFVWPTPQGVSRNLGIFEALCDRFALPLAPEKTVRPVTTIAFLGIQIHSVVLELRLPQHKIVKYCQLLDEALLATSLTLHKLRSVLGALQFATNVVLVGRPFLRRMYDGLCCKTSPAEIIFIHAGMKKDVLLWRQFLSEYNVKTFFLPSEVLTSADICLQTDAIFKYGAATCGKKWFRIKYPEEWSSYHIAFLVFYPIFVSLFAFEEQFRDRKIQILCENMANH